MLWSRWRHLGKGPPAQGWSPWLLVSVTCYWCHWLRLRLTLTTVTWRPPEWKGCNKGTLRNVLPCLPACVFSDIRVFSHREGSSQGSIQSSMSWRKLGIAVAFDIGESCVFIDYGILTSKLIKICVNCKLWYQLHSFSPTMSSSCQKIVWDWPLYDLPLTLTWPYPNLD